MNKNDKAVFITDMKGRLERAEAIFLVDYKGLDVEAMNRIRGELRRIDTEFQVVKNRLMKRATQGTGAEAIQDAFSGPCALVINYDDPVAPAKVLMAMGKDYKDLELKIGQISGKPITPDAIKRLAELPGRDQLLAQVFSAMQAVPTSLARALNGVITNLLNVLKAIETDKDNGEKAEEIH